VTWECVSLGSEPVMAKSGVGSTVNSPKECAGKSSPGEHLLWRDIGREDALPSALEDHRPVGFPSRPRGARERFGGIVFRSRGDDRSSLPRQRVEFPSRWTVGRNIVSEISDNPYPSRGWLTATNGQWYDAPPRASSAA